METSKTTQTAHAGSQDKKGKRQRRTNPTQELMRAKEDVDKAIVRLRPFPPVREHAEKLRDMVVELLVAEMKKPPEVTV